MDALREGLAPDGGLYLPSEMPIRNNLFWESLHKLSFADIAFEMARPFLKGELSDQDLREITAEAFDFPVKMVELSQQEHILELFHGPTLAFKDFGARFMARLYSKVAQHQGEEITILTATSGDTGSAVAHGFYNVPGVRVCLLFPKGKVSPLQEKQMTTLGKNIIALEGDGVFDDCQEMVKKAFLDEELNQKIRLSSANSINIARLLPQSFYYAYALGELQKRGLSVPVFSVPSGNFGNLTGGLFSMKMGMPAHRFLAATNASDTVPVYLNGGDFTPKKSVQTISMQWMWVIPVTSTESSRCLMETERRSGNISRGSAILTMKPGRQFWKRIRSMITSPAPIQQSACGQLRNIWKELVKGVLWSPSQQLTRLSSGK